MKKIICMAFAVIWVSVCMTAKVINLPDLNRPGTILIDKNQVFINDGPVIYIYSLADFSLQKKFGKKGEGPREFKIYPAINNGGVGIALTPDDIIATSIRRISVFSRKGDFKKVRALKWFIGKVLPLGERFVGDSVAQENGVEYVTLNIYGPDMEKEKEIYRRDSWNERKKLELISYTSFPIVYVNDGKIFVNGETGSSAIYVFNNLGKKIDTFTHDYEKREITSADREKYMKFFQNSPVYKEFIRQRKNIIEFPEYYPGIRHYQVADQKIYVATYKEKKGNTEFYLFDIKGKFLGKIMLPLSEASPIRLHPYTIHKNKLYQLIENPDSEDWELEITDIK
ncbi:MAG: hypothetical protein GY765_08225 [bacterium]|nr:hypothetical protein [bacterium]